MAVEKAALTPGFNLREAHSPGVSAFGPVLIRQGEPAWVVNTASRAGLMTGTSLYITSKHAELKKGNL